jgi:hypothetical protein
MFVQRLWTSVQSLYSVSNRYIVLYSWCLIFRPRARSLHTWDSSFLAVPLAVQSQPQPMDRHARVGRVSSNAPSLELRMGCLARDRSHEPCAAQAYNRPPVMSRVRGIRLPYEMPWNVRRFLSESLRLQDVPPHEQAACFKLAVVDCSPLLWVRTEMV